MFFNKQNVLLGPNENINLILNGLFDLGKARQGNFICIAHFIHSRNTMRFTQIL